MTAKTIAEAAAELRKLHAEMIEAGDAPDGVYSLKSHMEADVRFIRAAKDNVPALLDALEARTEALQAMLAFVGGMSFHPPADNMAADALVTFARSALEPKP